MPIRKTREFFVCHPRAGIKVTKIGNVFVALNLFSQNSHITWVVLGGKRNEELLFKKIMSSITV
jgi:hypothetical protein